MEISGSSYMYRLNSELLESERIFKLASARLNRDNTLIVTLLVRASDYDNLLSETLQKKVEEITRNLVPQEFHPAVVYKKTITDEGYISQCVNDFIYKESPLVHRKLYDCEITAETGYDTVRVNIAVPAYIYSFMVANDYAAKLANYLDSYIMETVEINLSVHAEAEGVRPAVVKHRRQKQLSVQKLVEVSDLESIVGAVTKMPKYISDAVKAESDNQTVCGKVIGFYQKTAKSTGKPFFTFKLDDTTAQIEAVYFPRDEKAAMSFAAEVRDGMTVCAEGPVSLSKFSNEFTLQVRRISRCKIHYESIQNDIEYLEEDENYIFITPEPYIEEEQANLFESAQEVPEALKGDFVVFDFETTGLDAKVHKIIEIGAVKMRDGKLIETFSTLIDPKMPIPADASATNNIYDEDVAGKPTIEDVIGDFYKFTRGSTLVGHNAETFDCNFLYYWGKQNKYNFDNPVRDTLRIAREKITSGGQRMSLSLLCKRFDIPLLEAHRALHDAIATAKLFKKLIVL